MKKLLFFLTTALALIGIVASVHADQTLPWWWNSGSSYSYPYVKNSGILVNASSTIGNGTQAGGLTINGGATTTGTLNGLSYINVSPYAAYQQGGTNILYASSTSMSVSVGVGAGLNFPNGASYQKYTAVGYQALGSISLVPGDALAPQSTAVGYQALKVLTTGRFNVAVGSSALSSCTTCGNSIGIGDFALQSIVGDSNNIAIGEASLSALSSGSNNMSIGVNNLSGVSSGSGNTSLGNFNFAFGGNVSNDTGIGNNVMSAASGNDNTGVGNEAGRFIGSGVQNTLIGSEAGASDFVTSNESGATALGYNAGYGFRTGSDYNTCLGYQTCYDTSSGNRNLIVGQWLSTGVGVSTGSGNILIGNGVRNGLNTTGSSQLNIGNLIFGTGVAADATLSTGNVGIGSSTPWRTLDVNGTIGAKGLTSGAGTSLCLSSFNEVVTCGGGTATSTGSYRNQTATVSSVNTFTPTASSTYSIAVSASIRTISAGTLTLTCTYTNVDGVASTATFFPMGLTTAGLSGTGSPALSPLTITPMKNSAITVVATFTGVSIQYDIDASIIQVGTNTQ